MSQFIGRRIVPVHGGVWDRTKSYEELTIVLHETSGDSYISRRPVPAGTVIGDTTYWMMYSLYSAQIHEAEQHLNEATEDVRNRIASSEQKVSSALSATEKKVADELAETERVVEQRTAAAEQLTSTNRTELDTRMDGIDKRLDANVAASTDKNADYAAEVVDARVDCEGETFATLGGAIRSIYPKADKRLTELEKQQIREDVTGTLIEGRVVNTKNGQEQSFTNSRCTDFIPVSSRFQRVFYTGRIFNWIGIAGYDREKNYLCSILDMTETEKSSAFVDEELSIPEGVSYIRASSYGDAMSVRKESDIAQMNQMVNQHEDEIHAHKAQLESLQDSDRYLAGEALYAFPQSLKYTDTVTGDRWNAASPILSTYYVPLTVLEAGYFVSLDFILVATGESPVKIMLQYGDDPIITREFQLTEGDNSIHFEIERHLITGCYKLRLRSDEKVMNYPYTDTKKTGYKATRFLSNEATEDVTYDFSNAGMVFRGTATVRCGGTDKELIYSGAPADSAAVGRRLEQKLDVRPSANLLNPDKYRPGWFAFRGSDKVSYHETNLRYGATDLIPVSRNGLITKGSGTNGVTSQVVYNENLEAIRYVDANDQYTFEEGDAYVVFCYMAPSAENIAVIEGTEYAFEAYSEYLPLLNLEKRVNTLQEELTQEIGALSNDQAGIDSRVKTLEEAVIGAEKSTLALTAISPVYTVCNDLNPGRNYHTSVWLDHLISDASWRNRPVGFGEKMEASFDLYSPIDYGNVYNGGQSILEKEVSQTVFSPVFEQETVTLLHRSTKVSAGEKKMAKVLVIGDSVTDSYLATANRSDSSLPGAYWAWVRYLFERDRIDAGSPDDAHLCRMLGAGSANGKKYGSGSSFKIGSTSYKAYAIGKGGWSAEDLNLPTFQSDTNINPFYDAETGKFSLKACVDRLKTLDDDGVTRLTVGETAGTEVVNAEAWDMCTPSHVVINLNHNSSLAEYEATIPEVVETIKREYPEVVVILMSIDETGTYNPQLYPQYRANEITLGGLHKKNVSIYQYIREKLEDESRGIYVCSGHLVQPAVESYPTLEYQSADSIGSDRANTRRIAYAKGSFGGPNWHPNNLAHAAWGYQLYALIKYTMAKQEMDAASENDA